MIKQHKRYIFVNLFKKNKKGKEVNEDGRDVSIRKT